MAGDQPAAGWPRWRLLFLPLLALTSLSLLRVTFDGRFYGDEIEHAHITWLLGQGALPYRDIHQIHMPLVWILSSPLLSSLPESAASLMALRAMCLAAIVATCWAAWLALDEVVEHPTPIQRTTLLLVIFGYSGYFHFDRFRPDPFMSLAVAWSVLALLRLRHAPMRYAFLVGAGLGIAAGFSTKMVLFCAMLPLLAIVEVARTRSWRPLLVGAPNLAGFLVGIVPVVAWPWLQGIGPDMIDWTIVHNSQMVTFDARNLEYVLKADFTLLVFVLASIFGAVCLVRVKRATEPSPWSPTAGLLIVAALGWSVRAIEPNHEAYNLMALAMPGGLLIAFGVDSLTRLHSRPMAIAAVTGLLGVLLWHSLVTEGIRMKSVGQWIPSSNLQAMIDLVDDPDDTCVGFAPFHPVFCRDATDLYLGWDLYFIQQSWVSEPGKQTYREMWKRAIREIPEVEPTLIVDVDFWRRAGQLRLFDRRDKQRFDAMLRDRYRVVKIKKLGVWVRDDRLD